MAVTHPVSISKACSNVLQGTILPEPREPIKMKLFKSLGPLEIPLERLVLHGTAGVGNGSRIM